MYHRDPAGAKSVRLAVSAIVAVACWLHPASLAAASTITYVQGTYVTPQTPQTSVDVTFTAAQATGDLNIVVVGWNDSTATVSAVTDNSGNTYTRAVGPTVQSGYASQSIYYAKNIVAAAAGANSVTVTFSPAAAYPDIRILEYSGADPNNPVDVTAASSGNSATSSSGAVTTTNATDLLFAANLVQSTTTGPGAGYTSRLLTQPDDDIAEDRMVTATGSYSATAPITPANPWIMQLVAFRTPSGGGTAPTVTGVSPNSGSTAGGTPVTITGTNFASGATVTFGATAATNVVVVSSTSLTATTPAHASGAVTVTVTVSGQSGSLASGFTYVAAPTVTSVSPNTGTTAGGTAVTITGANFAAGASVTFGGTTATNVVVVSSTSITATTPAGAAGAVTVTVTVSGQSGSLTSGFTYVVIPAVTSILPNSGSTAGGTAVTITGTNFVAGATVTFGGTAATNVVVVSSTSITATTPAGSAGAVTATVTNPGPQSGSLANGFTYVVTATTITYVQGNYATPHPAGTSVMVTFTAAQVAGDLNVIAVGWNDSTAAVSTVTDISGNTYTLAVGPTVQSGYASQSIYYAKNIVSAAAGANAVTVTFSPSAASPDIRILEYSGADPNNPVDVTAASSGNSATSSSGSVTTTNATDLLFAANLVQSTTAGPGAGFTSRLLTQPDGDIAEDRMVTATGSYSATAPITPANPWIMQLVAFRTPSGGGTAPTVSSVSPNSGSTAGGTAVTITGTNFATGATVTFGGTAATNIVVASSTSITATTPPGSPGAVTVSVSGQSGNLTSGFTYIATPTVSSISPYSGSTAGGTAVTITGTNFVAGATVTFGGTAATNVLVVSGTQITATTPVGSAGAVTVTVTNPGVQRGSLPNGFTYVVITTTSISYVQGTYATPQTPQSRVNVIFTAAQTAGDLNVVVVGWNDSTAAVSAVTDSSANTYTRAVGPTVSGSLSQSIYYAKNIMAAVAGANIVTVTFSVAAVSPDIRILEYSGADPNSPVDVTAANTGSNATSSSGSVTTTNPTDLLFGANIVLTMTSGPGAGFTSRLLTVPDGDIAEDQMVSAAGSYSATAPVNPSGQWIMQLVAFRAGSTSTTPLVSLSSVSINFGNQSTGGTSNPQPLTLTNFGAAQLAISSIVVLGGNAGDFSQNNNCGATLAPNASCTINVTFTPSTTGARSSSVTITDNALGSPETVGLSGTGTGFMVSPRVTALTFTRTQQFTASGTGVIWSVDGVGGGSAASGTITATGLYTPPASIGTHTVTATTSTQSASGTVYVTNYPGTFTYHNDNLRTGQNLSETVLTLSNVNQNQFGKLFSYPLDGIAFASPLYVANVNIPGQGYHNVVYVATENDSVYAFDADGLTTTPLWHVSFLGSGVTTVPCADTGECGDIPIQIGITSTPVIDQTSGTIYVVAATKEGASTWVQRLHGLDITTGAEKFGGPVVLQASLPGNGSGSSGGNVAFDPLRENQRPGLLLNNGVVYLAFASHGDNGHWHGWVLGYNATTLQPTMQYNSTPNGNGGGIWQGGGGLATDTTGDIYFVTGNGDFDVNTGGVDYGDSVEKLSPSGAVVDYFTPYDQQAMSTNDLDLGAGGPVMLVDQTTGPFPHLLITAGKTGTIYVINRDNLGKYNAGNDSQIVQSLPGVLPSGNGDLGNFSTPVFFNGYVYFGAISDTLKAFQMTNGELSTAPTSQSAIVYGVRGGSFAISANTNANGILWALQNNGADPNNDQTAPGVLFAYDATNLANELYDSSQAGSRDTLDFASKFSIPLVANGKVFVAGQTQLIAYGLLP
jgi:hypothetical protein